MTTVCGVVCLWAAPPGQPTDTLEREVNLKEVIVKPKKQKYSKKNNPAVDFVNKLRNSAHLNDPARNHQYYSFDRYGRITLAVSPFDTTKMAKGKYTFLKEFTDSSPLLERPVLPISVKEKSSTVYYTDFGGRRREIVDAVSRNGFDEIVSQQGAEKMLEDALGDIDLYQNDIALWNNRFVSPLSKIGPDFYMYFLSDTITSPEGTRWIELSFTPRVNTSFGFLGRLYVAEGDSTMFVRHARLTFPHHINVNYIDKLTIEQTYEQAPDGSRLKTMDNLQAELSLMPGLPGIYGQRIALYTNHSFEAPDSTTLQSVGNMLGQVMELDDAVERGLNDSIWAGKRDAGMSDQQKNVKGLMTSLRSVKSYRYVEKTLKILSLGYIPTNGDFAKSKFDIGPIFDLISYNQLEGWRPEFGGMSTTHLNPRWFFRGYVAYGLRDRRFKESLSVEYSFIDKKEDPQSFPVRSITVTGQNDVELVGQRPNTYGLLFQSLQRGNRNLIAYKRFARISYLHELENNLSWEISGTVARTMSTQFMPFMRPDGTPIDHYNTLEGALTLRWAPGEKFFETRLKRFRFNKDSWVFTLTASGSQVNTQWNRLRQIKLQGSIEKKFWLSAFGFIEGAVTGGKVFGTVPFTQLGYLPVNTSFFIVRETFTLANPMEFMGDFYGKWDVSYHGMGILFDRIPLISKLKMREIIGLRGWWSSLDRKNNPAFSNAVFAFPYTEVTTSMPRPYMELYVGLDNIFSLLRVDWVWRATYRGIPDCDKWGLRLAVHFSF